MFLEHTLLRMLLQIIHAPGAAVPEAAVLEHNLGPKSHVNFFFLIFLATDLEAADAVRLRI